MTPVPGNVAVQLSDSGPRASTRALSDLGGIAARAVDTPDVVALTDGTVTMTWREVAAAVTAAGGRLQEATRRSPRSRVGVCSENTVHTLIVHAAGLATGVGTVALSRHGSAREVRQQVEDTACHTVVAGPSGIEALRVAREEGLSLGQVVVQGHSARGDEMGWDEWLRAEPAARDVEPARPANPPLVFTSGTTGRARATQVRWVAEAGRLSSHQFLCQVAARSGFPPGPHLVVGPLQHNGPLTSLRHLMAGQPVVILPKFDGAAALRLIEHHGVSSTVMVPTHFTRLLALQTSVRGQYSVSSLQMVAHTGSACPASVKREMISWFGSVLVESYGGSELGTVCRIDSSEWLDHPGSVGRAVPPLGVEAYDDGLRPLARGSTGLLGISVPEGQGPDYVGDVEKTRQAYLRPGLATLGDVGHVDDDGYVFITDRSSDMVVSGGVNLYPAEVEQVLTRHPHVREVAVIGVPDPDMGEALKALVVADFATPRADELDAFCRRELTPYKCPRSYEFVESLPRNEMGKLDKRALRRPFWDGPRTIAG